MEEKNTLPKAFPAPGDVLAMLGIAFGAQVVVAVIGFIVLFFMGIPLDTTMQDPVVRGKAMAVFYFAAMSLTLFGVIFYRNRRGGHGPIAHFSARGLNPVLLIWGFALVLAIGVVIEPIISLLPDPPYSALGRGFWTVVSITVFAPLFEEALCRGVVLESLRAKYGVVVALLISSLFFGILHFYPAQVVGASVLGFVLGYVYIVTRSLWAPIILHAANNTLAYVLLVVFPDKKQLSDLVGGSAYMVIYILAVVVAAASAYMVWKSLERIKEEEKNSIEA